MTTDVNPQQPIEETPKSNPMDSFGKSLNELSDNLNAFADIYKAIEHQDSNIQYLNNVINNLVSQLNKYKRNQSWKLKILLLFNVITWVIMFIKL